jgi:hypothetical protein
MNSDYEGFPQTPIHTVPSSLDMSHANPDGDATPADSPNIGASSARASGTVTPLLLPESGLRRRGSGKAMAGQLLDVPEEPKGGRKQRPTDIKFDVEGKSTAWLSIVCGSRC